MATFDRAAYNLRYRSKHAPERARMCELGVRGVIGDAVTKFWKLVNKNGPVQEHCPELGPCWEWQAAILSSGYGQFSNKVSLSAHRVAFFLGYGHIDDALLVCHKCDNRRCVNPSHLFQGTHSDNNRDAYQKGRNSKKGERHHLAKLTEADVATIRLARGTQRSIGARFGVGQQAVSKIKNGQRWAK